MSVQQRKKLICIGDSNTHGFDPRGYLGGVYEHPWPDIIAEKTGWAVCNLGEDGRQIPAGATIEILDRQIQAALPADIMTVMLGGNDIYYHPPYSAKLPNQRMHAYITHLKTLIPEGSDCRILLIAPAAVNVPDQCLMEEHSALSELYQKIANTLACDYVDAASWDIPLSHDGVHYSEEGHRIFAENLIREILKIG